MIIVGAGACGMFLAYELKNKAPRLSVLLLEKGLPPEKRRCPIDGVKVKQCMQCGVCSIMNGFGGAGCFSDGKYNITNSFGGEIHQYIGAEEALALMWYIDGINLAMGGEGARLYSTADAQLKTQALRHDLHLLDAQVRHLGTDRNRVIITNIYNDIKDKITIRFGSEVINVEYNENGFSVQTAQGVERCKRLVLAAGRSGSSWIGGVCEALGIETRSNSVDIGVRVELPAAVFDDITNQVYESKILYRTRKYNDLVRTFCMNPHGRVVVENTNGIMTVNGHSYSDEALHTENTNFALLVSNNFTKPFSNSNGYGESIARLSNMLGGGVLVQKFGDLIKGKRTNEHRLGQCFVRPTLNATPGDLSLVIPKRQLDSIIEMIYALDKIAPGTANESTLLYGVEVKFYNSKVDVDENLESRLPGLYILGDGSGVTHSLSQAAASGVFVARRLAGELGA